MTSVTFDEPSGCFKAVVWAAVVMAGVVLISFAIFVSANGYGQSRAFYPYYLFEGAFSPEDGGYTQANMIDQFGPGESVAVEGGECSMEVIYVNTFGLGEYVSLIPRSGSSCLVGYSVKTFGYFEDWEMTFEYGVETTYIAEPAEPITSIALRICQVGDTMESSPCTTVLFTPREGNQR